MIGDIISLGTTIIDKIFPDKEAANQAKLKLLELQQAGELAVLNAELQLATGQIDINKIEAASTDNFRAGWRPMAGWACSIGLFYEFLLRPLLPWLIALTGYNVAPMPNLDMEQLMVLLGGLLGLGGFRSYERIKGRA